MTAKTLFAGENRSDDFLLIRPKRPKAKRVAESLPDARSSLVVIVMLSFVRIHCSFLRPIIFSAADSLVRFQALAALTKRLAFYYITNGA